MKPTGTETELNVAIKNGSMAAIPEVNYQNIAGGLADQMIGFIRPSEPRKCSPPFKMVIIDRRGTVVFECKVGKGGRVRPVGMVRIVQDSHFPATALLTDSSLVTRTFLIEQSAPSNQDN
jgi:hypothetical protein